jgi:hypothetical protein
MGEVGERERGGGEREVEGGIGLGIIIGVIVGRGA